MKEKYTSFSFLKTRPTKSREQLDCRFLGNKKYIYPDSVYRGIRYLSPG